MFSVLDSTNSMNGKNARLQRRIRFYFPFNMYINCRNHRVALCLLQFDERCWFCRTARWSRFSLTWYLENVPLFAKERCSSPKKAAVTCWLTNTRASQRILDCFKEFLEIIDQICLETKETDVRGYRNILMEHSIVFYAWWQHDTNRWFIAGSLLLKKLKYLEVMLNIFELSRMWENVKS